MNHPIRLAYDTAELGAAVRHARHESDFTQEHLAERLGVTRMTISRLERGASVSVETALRALSECGYAVALAPKFSRLVIENASSEAPG